MIAPYFDLVAREDDLNAFKYSLISLLVIATVYEIAKGYLKTLSELTSRNLKEKCLDISRRVTSLSTDLLLRQGDYTNNLKDFFVSFKQYN